MVVTILSCVSLIAISYAIWTHISKRDFNKSAEIKSNALLEKWKIKEERRIRDDAFARSRAVGFGKTIEHFVPFMKDFPVPPKDLQFYGNPVDYIGIKDRDNSDKCEVHFIEVKSGSSNLNKHQKNIKKAIDEGRVFFDIVSVDGLTEAQKTLSVNKLNSNNGKKRGRPPKNK
jgi:predicted Holliday junction resolvase-like endonuclease